MKANVELLRYWCENCKVVFDELQSVCPNCGVSFVENYL